MPTPEEIKTAQDKAAQDKIDSDAAEAKKAADEAKNKIEVKDGKVFLTEDQYNNLVGMKNDMHTYKDKTKELQAQIDAKAAIEAKAKEEKLIEDGKLKEALELKDQENKNLQQKFKDTQINNALTVKLIEAGIKSEYVALVDKSKVEMDDTGTISGVDEIVKSFVTDHPELVTTSTTIQVDNGLGGTSSGIVSDDDLRKAKGAQLMKMKSEDPVLYKRYQGLAAKGKQPPG